MSLDAKVLIEDYYVMLNDGTYEKVLKLHENLESIIINIMKQQVDIAKRCGIKDPHPLISLKYFDYRLVEIWNDEITLRFIDRYDNSATPIDITIKFDTILNFDAEKYEAECRKMSKKLK